jgi:hypothetical protein
MGAMKDMMIEQQEREAREYFLERFTDWFWGTYGRAPNKNDILRKRDDFEMEEAFEEAMAKDD